MTALRKGESEPQRRFRDSRFFHFMDEWYYLTREGMVEGPFKNRIKAEQNLKDYISRLSPSGA